MKRALILLLAVMIGGCASTAGGFSFTSTPSFKAASTSDRTIVIISDLHLGMGKSPDGSWYAKEDFHWQKALKSFLDEISRRGNDRVDLIIDGDFLEMWQPPASIRCEGASADLGCTVEEMTEMASWIAKAHAQEFDDIRKFAQKGENRLYIIPGNHDSALLIASVWEPIGKALNANGGRVSFIGTGVWTSTDSSIVVEHGHQIGNDVNRYETWPDIVRRKGDKDYVIRTWGERFVQKIFNDQEDVYPIIDNLSPESAGVRYRMEDRGVWGTASDTARFVEFNLFQTSLSQKVKALGPDQSPQDQPKWDIARARKLGHGLFVAAMPQDDAFRTQLIEDSDLAKKVRSALDTLANDTKQLPDEDVNLLCDQAAIRGNSVCAQPELGALLEATLVPRERVLATHLLQRQKEFPKMRYFVYGHTHLLEEAWRPHGVSYVQVLNSGAFQRLIDEDGFQSSQTQRAILG
jgi:UDP-2,3-diacylglucosamine pyrophosphatase LpxH